MEAINKTDLTEELIKELRRLRIANLKMKLHMEILVSHPNIDTSIQLKKKYCGKATFKESILYYN